MRDALEESFYINTGPGAQLLVYHLVERDSFTLAEAHTQLEAVVAREVPLRVIEDILRQLELYGLAAASMSGQYGWSIPLLRERLLTGPSARTA